MPSTATFVRLCQERNLQIPQSLAAVEARLAQSHVDSRKFTSTAAKREAVATLIWALAALQERNNKLVYSRWNHLSPSSLQAIRKLYDVPQERGRPASLAKVARHFWDNRPVGGSAPVSAAAQRQPSRATNPASYRRQPSAAQTSTPAAAVVPDSEDDEPDASVHPDVPSRASSPEIISSSQPGPRATRPTRAASSHQEGCDASYDVVVALFPSDLWRVAFDRTLSWDLPKKKQMSKLASTSPTGMSAIFNGNDVALLTYRLRLLLPAVPVGRALVDGRLIAEAARYPLAGHIAGVHPSVFQVYLAQCQRAWEEAVMHLRNPASEITASALARVKNIVLEWFAERRHMIDKLLVDVDGLDEIPRHVRRQEREVKELFSLHESFLANTPSWNGSWPANKTWFHLLMPFFNEHIGVELSTWPSAPASLPPPPLVQGSLMPGFPAGPPNIHMQRFLGRPASPQIVGSALAVRTPPVFPCRHCSNMGHSSWECPRNYYEVLGEACPGFDAFGVKIAQSWHNGELTAPTKLSWTRYIRDHNLLRSKQVNADVQF